MYESPERKSTGQSAPLPRGLRDGLEAMSGRDLSGVTVHYNSDLPHRVGALAYTQGQDVHLARGQEQHLAHEGWHVVQQMDGRVAATTEVNGAPVNDQAHLEREADAKGREAMQLGGTPHALQRLVDGK
jgi:hypothetical protein